MRLDVRAVSDDVRMAGVRFDEDGWVDPNTPVLPLFLEWVTWLKSTKATGTVQGYASDVSLFAEVLLETLERPPVPIAQPAMTAAQQDAVAILPAITWERAVMNLGALTLLDLHPLRLAKAFDHFGGSRGARAHARAMSSWTSLCELMVRRGQLAANPMADQRIMRPKLSRPTPVFFDYDESEQLLRTLSVADVARTRRKPWPARDLALAAILLTDGLRVSEACGVAVADLRALGVSPRLHVLGKGAKWRTLPVHTSALDVLSIYMRERHDKLGPPDPHDKLFIHADGRPFTVRQMQHLVYRWYQRAGIRPQGNSCVHALRHTFATQLLDSGGSVEEARELLGHASLDSTRWYLHVVGSGLEDAVRAHPAGAAVQQLAAGDPAAATVPDRSS